MTANQHAIVLEQSRNMVRIVFVCDNIDDADELVAGLYQQMKDGEISIAIGGKVQSVEDFRLKHLN